MPRVRRPLVAFTLAVVLSGCGGSSRPTGGTILIAVNAPFSKTPSLGETIARGVELAASGVGGVRVGANVYRVKVKRYDNALSPRRAVENVRRAVRDGAVAIVDEGTGVDASWRIARVRTWLMCLPSSNGRSPAAYPQPNASHGTARRDASPCAPSSGAPSPSPGRSDAASRPSPVRRSH